MPGRCVWWLPALAAVASGAACSSDIAPSAKLQEPSAMNQKQPPGASRPAPPAVAAIDHEGIRFEQDLEALKHGGDQLGGYLVAIDAATGNRLWMLKVYLVPAPSAPAVPRFGRYFRRMSLLPGGQQIEIENEAGGIYRVDLATRTSAWVSGPDSKP
jgi:hypothetical protein